MDASLTLLDLLERIYARAHDTEQGNLIDQLNWRAAAVLALAIRDDCMPKFRARLEPHVREAIERLNDDDCKALESMTRLDGPGVEEFCRDHSRLFNILFPALVGAAMEALSAPEKIQLESSLQVLSPSEGEYLEQVRLILESKVEAVSAIRESHKGIGVKEIEAYQHAQQQQASAEAVWKRLESWVRDRLPEECANDPLKSLLRYDTPKKWPVADALLAEKNEIPRLRREFAKIDTPESSVAAVKELRKRFDVPWLAELEREIHENAQVLIEGPAMQTLAALQMLSAMRSADATDKKMGSPMSGVRPNKANRASEPKPKAGRPTISPEKRKLYAVVLNLNESTKRNPREDKLAEFRREFPDNVKSEQDMDRLIKAAREQAKRDTRK